MVEKSEAEEIEEQEDEEQVETTPETTEAEPLQPTDEMKVVVIMKADKIMLGVQSPSCDPVYETMTGDLTAALERVAALVAEAKQKWEANPLNPKANLPEPPPPPPRTQPVTTSSKPKDQPSFF